MRRQWSYASVTAVALATTFHSAHAAESPASSDPPEAATARKLDLRIPPITSVFTPEQIAAFLAKTRDPDMDEIEVEGRREPPPPVTPRVWGGIAAPIWAVLNPSRGWRIFAPLTPDQLRANPPRSINANVYYVEPTARTALDL